MAYYPIYRSKSKMLQQKLIYVTVYLFRLIVVGIVCGITDPGDWNIQIRRPLLVVLYYFS